MTWRPVVAGFGICGLVLALVVVAVPQSSSPESTFASSSELVLVPVQVMDHGGRPLRGLKKDAFVLESDEVNMDRDAMKKALAHGWKLIDEANVPKIAIAVKVVVRDNFTGRIGSVVFPLAEGTATANWGPSKNGALLLLDSSVN